jgi:hypothetical protein
MSSITISLSSTSSRHSKRLREPLGDVTNTQQSKQGRTSTRDDQTLMSLLGKKVHLERWVPETDLLEELSISQADQSLHSARKKMELMLRTNKIPFVCVRKGHAKPLASFSQLPSKDTTTCGVLGCRSSKSESLSLTGFVCVLVLSNFWTIQKLVLRQRMNLT